MTLLFIVRVVPRKNGGLLLKKILNMIVLECSQNVQMFQYFLLLHHLFYMKTLKLSLRYEIPRSHKNKILNNIYPYRTYDHQLHSLKNQL